MTVIAWDGKAMAADRMRLVDGTPMPACKVFKVRSSDGRQFLVGCAGDSWDATQFLKWMRSQADKDKPAPSSLYALVIDEKRRIWLAAEKLIYHEVTLPFFAVGSGSNYAIGAMAAGKSARQAVRIAARFDNKCGLGVDVVRFR